VVRWPYQHQILAIEVKNSVKVKLLSFNRTDDFLFDVMIQKKFALEAK